MNAKQFEANLSQANSGTVREPSGIRSELESLTIGNTKVINGYPVTRWSAGQFEVGTWGRDTVSLDVAIVVCANN